MPTTVVKWEEPNRENAPPLHIADRGGRYPSLTGVTWLDQSRYMVAHRSGIRMALFDLRQGREPVEIFPLPHLADDIASRRIDEDSWEIALSGCWQAVSSRLLLTLRPARAVRLLQTTSHSERTFSHGVRFDEAGNLCVALHTGADPRMEIGSQVWRLPHPWGPRCICFDRNSGAYFVVAVSANPRLKAYKQTFTSVWSLPPHSDKWEMKFSVAGMHSDTCDVYDGLLWLPDQKLDQVIGVSLQDWRRRIALRGPCFDFPHGLAISAEGRLAVTNYGSSSVALIDLDEVLREGKSSHAAMP